MSNLRVVNTAVSGSALVAGLTGNDVRALEFAAALAQPPAVDVPTGSVTNEATLSVEQWLQASIASLGLKVNLNSELYLGVDTDAQARFYIELFNLKSLTEERVLRFHLANDPAGNSMAIRNNSSSPFSSEHVAVSQDGGANSNNIALFTGTVPAGGAFAGQSAGLERLVVVTMTNDGKNADGTLNGLAAVRFDVLSGSL